MALRLVGLAADADLDDLAVQLAPGFGGDAAAPREILEQTARMLASDPREDPWGVYIAYHGAIAVATGAFKSAPDADGTVEIAYMTFPDFEGRGHATELSAALTDIALRAGATTVIAHTLPEENASNRALRRNGFAFAGDVVDPEDGPVWRWQRS